MPSGLGRRDEALADYARATRLSPLFPEIHHNHGDLRYTPGDTDLTTALAGCRDKAAAA